MRHHKLGVYFLIDLGGPQQLHRSSMTQGKKALIKDLDQHKDFPAS